MFLWPPKAASLAISPEASVPPAWRRVCGIAAPGTWAIAAVLQLIVTLPFWLYSAPAPYYPIHGDLYRGWPMTYGLDQGDVLGDDWGPFITYFHPLEFAIDTGAAIACGLPAVALVLWLGRSRRGAGRHY